MPGRIDLHTHTKHSDGVLSPHELLSLARESKLKAIAITDHGNMYGAIKFYKECLEQNIKPIIGKTATVLVKKAITPKVAPNAIEPVSPIINLAG